MGKRTSEIPETDVIRRAHLIHESNGSPLYALYLVNVESNRILPRDVFGFDISPQSIRLDENAAGEVQATQEGGYWIDERGQYFPMLNVSGTFGFRPRPKANRRTVNRSDAQAEAQGGGFISSNISSVDQIINERTGFDRFRDLQNLFRRYWDRKKIRTTSAQTIMVWANWKMGEVYIAQPVRFGRDRTAPGGRFKITYNFQLRLLAPLNVQNKSTESLVSPTKQSNRRALSQKLKEDLGFVENRLTEANRFVKQLTTSPQDITRTIIDPASEAISRSRALLTGTESTEEDIVIRLAQIPIDELRTVHRTALEVAGIADALLTEEERISALSGKLGQIMKDVARKMTGIFVSLFGLESDDVNQSARAYANKYRKRDTEAALNIDGVPLSETKIGDNGSNTSIGSRTIPRGQKTISLPKKASIKTIATEFLGSAGRWKEIVLLNGLRAPYISEGGDGVNVLRPGVDTIFIPAEPEDDIDTNQVFGTRDDVNNIDAYRYGRDLAIDLDTRDFLVDNRGDLETVSGLQNLRQAANIKIFTKPGDLSVHPWFGFAPEGGEGVSIDVLSRYQLQFRTTLLSDTRIERVNQVTLQQSGDILLARISVLAKEQDDALSLDLRAKVR